MAEEAAEQAQELPNPVPQDDGRDNKSVSSYEPDITQQLSRLENKLKDEMSSIASLVKGTVLGMNQQMENKDF